MRKLIIGSVAGVLLATVPSMAFAACTLNDQKTEQELAKIEGIYGSEYGAVRRDMRELRSAASVLQRYGKDEACQKIVDAMSELLRDPKASSDLRNKGMNTTGALDPNTGTANPEAVTDTAQVDTTQDASKNTTVMIDQDANAGAAKTTTIPDDTANTGSTDATKQVPEEKNANTGIVTFDQRRQGAVPFTERKTALSSAELIGSDVYGPDNRSIGEIDDIIVSPENQPTYALVSYGGFLGMGESQAAIPVASLRVSPDNYFFVNMTADQLKSAPKLKRGTADWWTNDSWRTENDAFYKTVN